MTTSHRQQAVLNGVSPQAYTHDTVLVTVTGTMKNGSLLKADFTEAEVADAATALYIIDDPQMSEGLYGVGEKTLVAVAANNVIANDQVVCFSDETPVADTTTSTALIVKGVKFASA